ncbi:MAG: hypothetical protein R6V16_00530 [Bacteroidales bacterium]
MIKLIIHDREYRLTEHNDKELFAKLILKYKPTDQVIIEVDGVKEKPMDLDGLVNFPNSSEFPDS